MLIGFCGKRTAGKTTAANVLIESKGFERAKFAAPLKAGLRATFGLTDEQTDGSLKDTPCPKLDDRTPRAFMEWYGEAARQRWGEDFWCRLWLRSHDLTKNWVFDDARNPNEVQMIQAAGGRVVLISSEDSDALPVLESERQMSLVKPDLFIRNHKTSLHTLRTDVLGIYAELSAVRA